MMSDSSKSALSTKSGETTFTYVSDALLKNLSSLLTSSGHLVERSFEVDEVELKFVNLNESSLQNSSVFSCVFARKFFCASNLHRHFVKFGLWQNQHDISHDHIFSMIISFHSGAFSHQAGSWF